MLANNQSVVADDTLVHAATDRSSPCACSSGLTAGACCEIEKTSDRVQSAGASLVSEAELAADALRKGHRSSAAASCLAILETEPAQSLALATLAEVRLDEGNKLAASALLRRLIDLEPVNFWPINKIAMLELKNGETAAAEYHARQGIRIAADNPQAHNLMGMVMTEAQRPVIGEYHCRRALELLGRRIPLIVANLATCLKNQGRIGEARTLYAEADELAPNNSQTLLAWAQMEEADRQFDQAKALLDRLDRLGPPSAGMTLTRAAILGRQKRYGEALALIDSIQPTHGRELLPFEHLERGRLLDKMDRYDEAWAAFDTGKSVFRQLSGQTYLADENRELVQNLERFFQRDRIDSLPRAEARSDCPQPIFILGFPRSGTTLIEQTLSTCSRISAGDELHTIMEIAQTMSGRLGSPWAYPGALGELWMGDKRESLDGLRDYYLQKARQLGAMGEGADFFTDKMPLNEIHLGLIAMVFPKAPLIHLIRHPLDIMVSAMSNMFSHGGHCGSALESAAEHLVLSADLVAHYRAEMDLNYLPVRYEDVVDDQEATVRRIFEFIGVEFEPTVLQHETNTRYARTASYAQVTEKLYDRSRYRYRHYRRHLEPVIPILRPLIERLGYTVESI